jgi:lipopolysaccharide exporter
LQAKQMSSEINKKSVSAVKWAAAGTVIRFGLQLFTQVILARLLGPESYGLFAMGLIVLTLSTFVADFGFSWGLVQNQELKEEDVRFAFTWQLVSGGGAALLLFLCSPLVARYFNEPRVAEIVAWLSLTCLFNAMAAPGTNLLRRKLDFRTINIIQIASYTIGYMVVGVSLAYLGAGVWALVCAWLAQSASALVLTFLRSPHSLRLLFWYDGARRSTSVGATVFVTNLCNWFLNNIDRLFLGRFLNAHAVGVYTVGYNLANTPNSLFLTALQPAFLAAGAKLQDDRGRLREAYLSIQATTWIIIGPAFVLLAAVAPYLIALLYGDKWNESAPVLAILALAMPAYVSWGLSTPVLWNTGAKNFESLLQLPVIVAAGGALWMYADKGPTFVAMIASVTLLLRAILIGGCACIRLNVRYGSIFHIAWRSAAVMALTVLGAWGGAGVVPQQGPLASFVLASGAGILLPAIAVVAWPPLLGSGAIAMLSRFTPPIPSRLGAYLRSKCSPG